MPEPTPRQVTVMLTPEQFADEVGRRVVQLASDHAASQGARLSKRDRDTLRTGAIMAAPVTFSLIREESLRAQADKEAGGRG